VQAATQCNVPNIYLSIVLREYGTEIMLIDFEDRFERVIPEIWSQLVCYFKYMFLHFILC